MNLCPHFFRKIVWFYLIWEVFARKSADIQESLQLIHYFLYLLQKIFTTWGLQTKGGGDESRPNSRASMGRNDSASRPPSRGEMISSRPPSRGSMVNGSSYGSNYPSRGPSMSRCASPTPSYYARFFYFFQFQIQKKCQILVRGHPYIMSAKGLGGWV